MAEAEKTIAIRIPVTYEVDKASENAAAESRAKVGAPLSVTQGAMGAAGASSGGAPSASSTLMRERDTASVMGGSVAGGAVSPRVQIANLAAHSYAAGGTTAEMGTLRRYSSAGAMLGEMPLDPNLTTSIDTQVTRMQARGVAAQGRRNASVDAIFDRAALSQQASDERGMVRQNRAIWGAARYGGPSEADNSGAQANRYIGGATSGAYRWSDFGGDGGPPRGGQDRPAPWWRPSAGGTAFGMPVRLGVVAAAYAGYRQVDNAVSAWDAVHRPQRSRDVGDYATGADEYYNQERQNYNSTGFRATTWALNNLQWIGAAATGPIGYVGGSIPKWLNGGKFETADQRFADARQMRWQMMSRVASAKAGAENIKLGGELRSAQFDTAAAGILDPLAKAERAAQDARVKSYAETDAEIESINHTLAAGGRDLNEEDRVALRSRQTILRATRESAANVAQEHKRAAAVAATTERSYSLLAQTHGAQAAMYAAGGDPLNAALESLSATYSPKIKQLEADKPSGWTELRDKIRMEWDAQKSVAIRHTAVNVASQQATTIGQAYGATGDFGMQSYAAWLPYRTAMQNGLPPNSIEGRMLMEEGKRAQFGIDVAKASTQESLYASENVLRAVKSGDLYDARREANLAHYNNVREQLAVTHGQNTDALAKDPKMIAETNRYDTEEASINRDLRLSRMGIDASAASDTLRGQFKPVEAALTDIYNQGAIAAAATPANAKNIKRATRAALDAQLSQYLSGSRMASGDHGFSWQVDTSGTESGYESLGRMVDVIDGFRREINSTFKPTTPLGDAYAN